MLMKVGAVICMPRGCTSALRFVGKETLHEARRNTVLIPTQAQVHIGHRNRYTARCCTGAPLLKLLLLPRL